MTVYLLQRDQDGIDRLAKRLNDNKVVTLFRPFFVRPRMPQVCIIAGQALYNPFVTPAPVSPRDQTAFFNSKSWQADRLWNMWLKNKPEFPLVANLRDSIAQLLAQFAVSDVIEQIVYFCHWRALQDSKHSSPDYEVYEIVLQGLEDEQPV
jgi:hypothetical protein